MAHSIVDIGGLQLNRSPAALSRQALESALGHQRAVSLLQCNGLSNRTLLVVPAR
jgi:hypothetical protein